MLAMYSLTVYLDKENVLLTNYLCVRRAVKGQRGYVQQMYYVLWSRITRREIIIHYPYNKLVNYCMTLRNKVNHL